MAIKKKILAGLVFMFSGIFAQAQNGLDSVIVEKYYVSHAADTVNSALNGVLPVGSVTYRIYVDLAPGYELQALYGVPGHELRIETSTSFFNNEDRGETDPIAISVTSAKKYTVMLDSWFSVGAAASGKMGVLKTEDSDGSIGNNNGILQNNDPTAGIQILTQDGMIPGTPETVTPVGVSTEIAIFNKTNQMGNLFITSNGSIASLNGSAGPTSFNRVLVGQFTTEGVFSFKLNVQIGTPTGGVENYVAENPLGAEIQLPCLVYPQPTPPIVSISSPLSAAVFSTGTIVPITAVAADADGTVDSVEFFVNAAKIGVDVNAPYQVNWTSTAGTHTLTAVASDNENKQTISVPVTISAVNNVFPTVSISSPIGGASFTNSMPVSISVSAADADGTVDSVEFFVNGIKISVDTSVPYQANWIGVSGTTSLTAVATDNQGAQTTSAAVIITILTNYAPVISITSPLNNASFTGGAVIAIIATASDPDGTVDSVEFFINGAKIGVDLSFAYQVNWNSSLGTYTLTAVATDHEGAQTASAMVTISVITANVSPTVSITSPLTSASFITGSLVKIIADASDPDGTISVVDFFINGAFAGTDVTAPYEFNWTSTAGTKTLKAIATDNSGAQKTSSNITITVVNNVLPTVSIVTPTGGSTFTAGDVIFISANASDADGAVVLVQFFVKGILVNIDSVAPYHFNWTSYACSGHVTAVAIDNNGGQKISMPITITVKNNVAPTVSISSPTNNSTKIGPGPLIIQATATDADGYVDSVEFYVNALKVGVSFSAPFQCIWMMTIAGKDTLVAIAVDNHGMQKTSANVVITVKDTSTSGMGDIHSLIPLFNIYPNPTNGIVTMEILLTSDQNNGNSINGYTLYNMEGKKLLHKELGKVLNKQLEKIDLSAYENGQYVIELLIDGMISTKTIIKK